MEPGPNHSSEIARLRLDDSPARTKLRLPSRIAVVQWLGLALLLGMPAYVFVMILILSLLGGTEQSGLLAGACLVFLIFLGLACWVVWEVRCGARVTVTANRLVVKKPWGSPDKLELLLDDARVTESQDAILIFGRGEKRLVGNGLSPAERRVVVDFLKRVIADRLESSRVPSAQPVLNLADDATPGGLAPSDEHRAGLFTEQDPPEIRLLATCRRIKAGDKRKLLHLAPNIPQPVLATAIQSYLEIQDDEVLLAIAGVTKQGAGIIGCAITTKRIYWPGKPQKRADAGPPRCRSLEHVSLPEIIDRKPGSSALQLREGRKIILSGPRSLGDGLIALLAVARSSACDAPAVAEETCDEDRRDARQAWPRVAAANEEAKALQAEIRRYVTRTQIVSTPVVTRALIVACVAVFLAMLAEGVSWKNPQLEQLLKWGAHSGKGVIIDHQYWRLLTSMFVHVGLWHLLLNMFCLVMAGPLVERLFGHLGFAALYVLSGIGGSIVSVLWQPALAGAGASGAIFGIFGSLLGFLAIRHRAVPFAILKPMRAGAIGFVAFNTFFSAVVPGISMSAHMGGLVTGFVCGLLMTAVAPADARARSRVLTAVLRAAVAALLAVGMMGLAYSQLESGKARILAPLTAINGFLTATPPVYAEFNRIAAEADRINSSVDDSRKKEITETLGRLKSESDALANRVRALPAGNSEVEAIRDELVSAADSQRMLLDSIEQHVTTGDEKLIDGPGGLRESQRAYEAHLVQVNSLVDAYAKAHGLQMSKSDGSAKP